MQDTTFDNTTLNLSDFDLFDFDDPHFETKQRIRIALASSMYLVTFVFGSIGMGKVNSELSIWSPKFISNIFFEGNCLVIFSIIKVKKLQSVTNLFLISLATADLLLILFCVPIRVRNRIYLSELPEFLGRCVLPLQFAEFFANTWAFGTVLCKLVHYLQNVSSLCSVFNLTAMSLGNQFAC